MTSNAPSVMVSSTFFDLRQIRADLAQFLENDLGYRALLSEYPSFPIDPGTDTIENCRQRVERDADILILVIGGRYGVVDSDSGKSITNLEYLTARSKGIPIYTFVEKSVLSLLPVWERSPTADFSHTVSDTRLFEFVRQIRTIDQIWMHEFEQAKEIITILRAQFAYLMQEGLQLRFRLSSQVALIPSQLRGKALRLALEKPKAWEYRLFAQALADEVESHKDLRREHKLKLVYGSGDRVELPETISWVQARNQEIERFIQAFTIIMDHSLQEALGPPGKPGSVEALVFNARQLGTLYRSAIEWSQRVRRAHLPECFRPVASEMALFTDDMIEKVEAFGPNALSKLEEALSSPSDGTVRELTFTLKLDLRNLEGFQSALQQAQRDCFGV